MRYFAQPRGGCGLAGLRHQVVALEIVGSNPITHPFFEVRDPACTVNVCIRVPAMAPNESGCHLVSPRPRVARRAWWAQEEDQDGRHREERDEDEKRRPVRPQ